MDGRKRVSAGMNMNKCVRARWCPDGKNKNLQQTNTNHIQLNAFGRGPQRLSIEMA